MILADTSVWVNFLAAKKGTLGQNLEAGEICMHSLVIGELACGSLNRRQTTLHQLRMLPRLPPVTDDEAIRFIDRHRIMSRGIGFIDVHLLASVAATPGTRLWTREGPLGRIAEELGLEFM